MQVWKAELALSDFVLHTVSTSSEFDRVVALELGAGTGMLVSAACLNISGDTVPKN